MQLLLRFAVSLGLTLFASILKHKRRLKGVAIAAAILGFAALVWFTVTAPERGRNAQATVMEQESAQYFATERDLTALASDARSGAARSIGLSMEYALVDRVDGGRYYVRIDTQRALVAELLKDKVAAGNPAIFSLSEVQPPTGPLH